MKKLSLLASSLVLFFAASNAQAVAWLPSSGTVNTIELSVSSIGVSADFALFASAADLAAGTGLDIVDSADTIYVDTSLGHTDLYTTVLGSGAGGAELGRIHLGPSGSFLFGADFGGAGAGTFISEIGFTLGASGIYNLTFNEGIQFITLAAIDVTPVPEPSTYLLFGLGLLGLAAIRRRKSAKS